MAVHLEGSGEYGALRAAIPPLSWACTVLLEDEVLWVRDLQAHVSREPAREGSQTLLQAFRARILEARPGLLVNDG